MRGFRRAATALGALLVAAGSPGLAAESARAVRDGGARRIEVELDGALVSALTVRPDELLLLIRPADEVDGPRRLARLTLAAEPRLERLASDVPGWTKTLAALEMAGGTSLVVGGLGRVDRWGDLAAPSPRPSPWLAHPGLDLRSIGYSELAHGVVDRIVSAEAGWLRVWRPDEAGVARLESEWRLPLEVEREATGLEITSPPVALLSGMPAGAPGIFAGPSARGGRRLIVAAVDAEGDARECWLALPGVEKVERSWLVDFDGEPALVVHAQGAAELNVFEDQRYRVFPLAPDRTRKGRSPRLAVEVDSKRWQDSTVTVADADGDGDDDLVLVRPEGMTGGDLVVEVYSGRGGVRFERGSRRTDLDSGPAEWRVVGGSGAGSPTLATLDDGRLQVWRFAASGRRALERRPLVAVTLPDAPPAERRIELRAGGGDGEVRDVSIAAREILGDLETSRGRAILVLERDDRGAERLFAIDASAP